MLRGSHSSVSTLCFSAVQTSRSTWPHKIVAMRATTCFSSIPRYVVPHLSVKGSHCFLPVYLDYLPCWWWKQQKMAHHGQTDCTHSIQTHLWHHVWGIKAWKDNALWRWHEPDDLPSDPHCNPWPRRAVSRAYLEGAGLISLDRFMCACHQGTRATHPCPKCLVHQDAQSDLLAKTVQRNHESSAMIIRAARQFDEKEAKALLKQVSLYLVNVSFSTTLLEFMHTSH